MKRLSLLIALASAVALPRAARADDCDKLHEDDPQHPAPIVYMQVGDTQVNLMKRLGRAMRDNGHPVRMVFITDPSCTNINTIYGQTSTTIPKGQTLQYLPSKLEDPAWDAGNPMHSATLTCSAPAAIVPHVANSALFNSACPAPPATPGGLTVVPVQGPTQAYVLAVPTAAVPNAITFEEAYFVFGFGMQGMIAPWVDEKQLFIRKPTTSTLLAWAANLGIPAGKFLGVQEPGSPDVTAAVQSGTQASIGILGAEVYDGNRTTLKALAYRAKGQYAAYYPDSSFAARDKKNVRDGHYTVWSPTVWMYTKDASGAPTDPDAKYIVDLITGSPLDAGMPAPTGFSVIADAIAPVGLVPTCAMQVNRDFEGGELRRFTPPTSCTCTYEKATIPNKPSACAACDANTPCATGVCREGLCEAR
ncbi:MAG TPA: hypothetical protein VFP84_40890 [Kofleriaceae bacterium]|nr:hypothetical protein [Kofleriaceae bacterium]